MCIQAFCIFKRECIAFLIHSTVSDSTKSYAFDEDDVDLANDDSKINCLIPNQHTGVLVWEKLLSTIEDVVEGMSFAVHAEAHHVEEVYTDCKRRSLLQPFDFSLFSYLSPFSLFLFFAFVQIVRYLAAFFIKD